MPSPRRKSNRICATLFVLLFASIAPKAYAKRNRTVDDLAAQLALKLAFRKVERVAVCPFASTNKKDQSLALGELLSDRFIRAMASHLPHALVLTRAQLIAAVKPFRVLPIDVDEEPICKLAAATARAGALVTGNMHFKDNGTAVELSVSAVQAKGWNLGEGSVKIPMDERMQELRHEPVYDPAAKVYLPDSGGVSGPTCINCRPDPHWHPTSSTHVIFLYTITAQGTTANIVELGHPSAAASRAFIGSMPHWRFKPAHLHDGTAVAVHIDYVVDIQVMM